MITLTKLDESKILLNLDAVKYFEAVPDTLIFFLNGTSVMVKESLDEILNRTIKFRAKVIGAERPGAGD